MTDLTISASQLETKARCDRLWYFLKKLRLPEPQTGANQILGSVLHAVLERYLKGEDLYPEGWFKHKERDGKTFAITPKEQSLVKKLVAQGIEKSIVEPREDQEVEFEFTIPVMEGVRLYGFIDILEPAKVIDHKTAKNDRYLKTDRPGTANYLGDNIQMLTYAHVAVLEAEKLGGNPAGITVRHNQFIKNEDTGEPEVRQTETTVSRDRIKEHWSWIQQQSASMLKLKQVKDWESIDAPNRTGACKEYGGCAFAGICGGSESIDSYRERLASEEKGVSMETIFDGLGSSRSYQTQGTDNDMSFFKNPTRATAPPSMPSSPSLNAPVAVKEPEPEVVDEERRVAPWAVANCKACKGTGINSKGAACRICDGVQHEAGGLTSDDFNARFDVDRDMLVWDETIAPPMKEEEVEEEEEEEQENPDEVEETKPTPAKLEPKKEPKTRGRKKKGITLLVNCTFTKGPNSENYRAEDLLQKFGAALAEQLGKESYYALNAFDRRDMLAQKAEEIVEYVGTATVEVRTSTSPDVNALVAALKPFVGSVVEGVCG